MGFKSIRHVVFDLGGVLVDFQGVAALAARLKVDPDTMAERWLASPAVRAYERGQTTTDTFVRDVLSELNEDSASVDLDAAQPEPLTADELHEQMTAWLPRVLPGAFELLRDLRENQVPHSCLSNTNAFHWRRMQDWRIHATCTHTFLSHELGMVKPDREIFEVVTRQLKLKPRSVAFFDDHPANVAAALSYGFNSTQTIGPEACRQWLVEHEMLPASR